jgi:hypothetical protein
VLLAGGLLVGVVAGLLLFAYARYVRMPGRSHTGPLPASDAALDAAADRLRQHVMALAGEIGERHVGRPAALAAAAEHIAQSWAAQGYRVERQGYTAFEVACENLYVERRGASRPDEIIVVGAHYDSVPGSPGANDNASGVAVLLELSRAFAAGESDGAPAAARTLRFVAFVNEEAPFGLTPAMGSYRFARLCRERGENIVGMLSLETMGYYHDEPGSQLYPFPLGWVYPSTGDFVAFVGNDASAAWVRAVVGAFRERARFPSQGGALPAVMRDAARSDQWSFWQHGYPGLMVTDTANFRYPYYHTARDTPDKLNYARLAHVAEGLRAALGALTSDAAAHGH